MSYIDDLNKRVQEKNKETAQEAPSLNSYNQKTKAPSLSSRQTSGASFNSASRVSKPANNNWYQGNQPTVREVYGQIGKISKQNPSEGNRILNMFQQERSTPGNPYYNPYAQATNRAVSAFTDDDIGSDAWQQRYAYTQDSLVYNGYTNTPSAPTKKSSPEQIVAYNVYQVNKSEPGTRAAEQEWKDLQDELKWKANNPGNYWSDDDIVNSVDWNNYPTLKKMREGGNEAPMEFNRPIGFSEENMYGTIWSARNNGGTGDATGDAIMSAAGEGKQWQEDPVTTAKMTKGSATYSPHEVGPVALDKALQYFGIYKVTPEWIAENREPILNSGNETAIKYLGMFLDAEDTTVAATEETAKLNKKIEGWVNRSGMTNERLQQNINNYINDECPTLQKIDKGIYNPNHLVPTNRAIPYNKNQMILDAQAQLQDNTVKPSAMASMSNLVNEIGQLGQQKTTDWTEVKNKSNMSRSFANGFQEGRDVAGGMASATDGLTLEREEEEAGQQQVTDSEDELENAPSAVDDANVPVQEDVPQESAMNPQSPEVAVADAENAATAQKRVKPLLGDSLKKSEAVTPEEPGADLNEKQPDSLLPSKFHSEILEEQYWQEDKRLSDVIDSIDWRDEIPEQASFENDPSPRTDSINAMFNDIVNADGDQIKLGVNRLVAKNGTQEYFGSGIASQYYLNTYRQHKDNYDYSLSNENKLFAELGENFILSQEEIEKNPTQKINVNGTEAVLNYARDEEGGLYINGITIDGHEYFISDNFTLDDAAWVLDENNEAGARQIIDNSTADMISHDDAVREAKANAPEPTDEQKAKYQEYLAYRASRIVNEDWLGKNNTEYGRQLAINTDAENNWDFMISRMSEEGYDTADLETAHGVATFTGRFGKAYTPVVYAYTGKKDENGNLVFEPTNQKSAYWCDNVIDSILTGKFSPEEEEQAMAWMENQAEERRAAIQNIDFTIAFCEDRGIEIPAEYKANMLKSKERMQRELDAYDYGKLVLTPEARERYNNTDWENDPMLQLKSLGEKAPITKGIGTKILDFVMETGGGNPFSKVQNGDEKDEQWIFNREANPRETLIYSILAHENPEAAEKYIHFMANQGTGILTTRQVEEYEEDSQNMVDSGFVGGTAATLLAIGTAPLETVEALGFYGHALIHGEYPEHSSYLKLYKGNAVTPSAVNNSINKTLGEDSALGVLCKGLYSILYNNGRSLVSGKTFSGFTDLFMSSGSALGKLLDVTPISLAASAASAESTYAITDNPTAATLMGIITFVCEAGSEFIEFGNLEKALTAGTLEGSLKAYRRGLPANALAEGFGEWLNNVVENNANDIILKDDSEFEQSVYGHLCNGARTIEEARARARQDRFNDDIFTFITSSMGTFLEAGGVIGSYAARKTNARISTSIYNRTHPGHEITIDQFLLQKYGSRADELVSNNVTQSALNDYMLLEHAAQDSSSISSAAFARVISEDMDTGLAAAVNGQNLFGGRKAFAGMMKSLVNGSAMSKETTDAMKQGIVFATLGGNESACAQLVRSDEFWNMTPNNKAASLAEAARTDAQNESVQNNVQSAVYDNRVANEEKKIIAKGLDNSLALKTAKKKLDSAKETLDAATKELDRVTNELKQAQDGLKTTGEIAAQDASPANLDQLVSQGKAVARANQVVNEYEQSVQNKQQAVSDAEQAHADAQQEYLDSVRNQARQNVAEIDQHRAEIKEKMEQAKAVAEQNRMVRQEVDNIARMQGDAIIMDLQNKGYNPTAEEQEKIYRMVNQMRQEITPEAFQRRDEFARQVSRKFGIPISFEDTTHGGVVERQNGYYDAKKNRIVIDQNASINDTMYVVLGHELTHAAEKSGTYRELSDALIATEYNGNDNRLQADILARQTLYNNRLSKMHEQDSSIDATPLTEEEAKQEIVADLMGKLLRGDQNLANRLAADSPNVVKRIINSIKSFLNKIRGVDGDFRTNNEKIVDMLENALKDAQAQKGTGTDTSNVKKQFDLSAPVEVRDDGLVAVHNIGVDNLNSVIRMGTIPAPSLAIIAENSSWTSFAPISLYFNGDVALNAIKNGRAYTGDAMTPTLGIREHTSAEGALEYIKQQPERSYESDNLIEAFEGYKRISNVDEARKKLYRKQSETDEGRKEINRVLNEKQFNVNSIVKDAINRSLVTVEGMTGEEATDYEIKNSRMIEKAIGIGALEGYEAIQKKMADGTRIWNIDTVGMIGESVEEKLKAYLHRDFSGLDLQNNEELEEAVMDFADYANENMSSGMVEAKPYENIDFSNIAEIHVPSSLAQGKVDEIMAGLGLDDSQVKTYDPNVAGSREELARNVAKQNDRVRFSLPEVEGTDGSLVELPGGTVAQSKEYSISSWTDEEKTKAINKLIENGFNRADINKWINDIDDIGLAIAEDASRLDFTPDREQSFLKSNSDVYKYTLDASTLCAKRLLYQGTFNAIQKAMPNTPLYAGDLIELANMMRDMGYQVPCAICYVESQRRDTGKFTEQFIDKYAKEHEGGFVPTYADLTSSDGLYKLREEHPEVYKAYIKANNKRGNASIKPVELRTDYRGEVRDFTKNMVNYLKSIGGLRVQSFSDFETPHLMDMMQAVLDMSAVGLTSQAYTKVPNFAWVFGDTGIKINLSLMGEGTGVDENGNLVFSSIEGMDFNEAMKIRDRYSKNVGTILVGMNDAHILAAMADPRIDYIIPFHRSGWSKENRAKMKALANYTDYQDFQNERTLEGYTKEGKPVYKKAESNLEPVGPNGYWDFNKSGKENAETYLRLCAEKGVVPKFDQFLDRDENGHYHLKADGSTDGYWKTLIDFKMYDNDGVGSPQEVVTPNINMAEAFRTLNEFDGTGVNSLPVASDVVEQYVEQYKKNHPLDEGRTRYSLPADSDYLSAVNHGDMDEAQKIIDQKAQEAGYVKAAFHGTLNGGFTIFDKAKAGIGGNSGAGFYFSSNESDSEANYSDVEGADNWFKARNLADRILDFYQASDEEDFEYEGYEITEGMPYDEVVEIAKKILTKNPETYHVYLNPGKAYIRDFSNSTNLLDNAINNFDESLYDRNDYDNEDDWYDALSMGRSDEIYQAISDAVYEGIADVDSHYEVYDNVNYEGIISDLAQIAMDYDSLTWEDLIKVLENYEIDISADDMEGPTDGSHEIARAIVEAFGFDSIEDREVSKKFNQLRNMSISGGTVHYIMFHPNQIKLADAVTYDDQGNIIPPSERFREQSNDIRYSLPSDEILDQMIRQYILDDQNRGLPPSGTGLSTEVSPEESGNAQRQFGSRTAQESDALHQEVKDYLYNHSGYTPDSNAAQVNRALQWVSDKRSKVDPDGFYAALDEVTSEAFDYRSADGQARMLAVMSMAALKGEQAAAEGNLDAQNYYLAQEVKLADAYNKQGTDLGRQLQARKIFRLMTPIGRISYFTKVTDDINNDFARRGKGTKVSLSPDTIRLISEADTEEKMDAARQAVEEEVAAQMPADWQGKLQAWRMVSMLANPTTHIRNMLGNAMFVPAVSIKNKIGAAMEIISRQDERTKTLMPIVSKEIRAFAWAKADQMRSVLTGEAKYNETSRIQNNIKYFGQGNGIISKTFGKAVQAVSDYSSNKLEGEDWYFLKRHFARAFGGWMQANGYTAEQLENNPDLMSKGEAYAVEEAQKATYRDFNELAKKLNDFVRNPQSKEGKVAAFLLEATVPFKKTPINILKRGIEYSPVELLKTFSTDLYHLKQYDDWKKGKLKVLPDKALSPNQWIDNCAKGLTGTGIVALGALLGRAGIINAGLDDDDEDKFAKAQGKQGFAINATIFGHKVNYTIDWAAPMSMPLFVGAIIGEMSKKEGNADIGNIASAILDITEPVFNLSMLDGINSLLRAAASNGTDKITPIFKKIGTNYVSSLFPSFFGKVASFLDPVKRKTFVKSGEDYTIASTREQLENKHIWARRNNIPVRDVWGNEVRDDNIISRAVQNFISPGYWSVEKDDPQIEEMHRLYQSTGIMLLPTDLPKTISVNGENVALEANEWDQIWRDRGQIAQPLIIEMMNSDYYKNCNDDYTRASLIDHIWEYATQTARFGVNSGAHVDSWVNNSHANPVQGITNKVKSQIKNSDVSTWQDEAVKAVEQDDPEALETAIEALDQYNTKSSSGKDKAKSAVSARYKPDYIRAYQAGEEETMWAIEDKLEGTGLGFSSNDYQKWIKEADEQVEEDEDELYNGTGAVRQPVRMTASAGMSDAGGGSGYYGRGNIDLNHRQVIPNPEGGYSTELSFSFYDDESGKEVLIPSVVNGQIVSEDEAINHYYETGEYLGMFDTPEEADKYAEELHQRQEQYYGL